MAHKKARPAWGLAFRPNRPMDAIYCWVTIAVLLLPVWLTLA